tara:strand:+ start:19461 stop:20705 length:1245 start_codon:yes stop_codon:yes gene_type:complete
MAPSNNTAALFPRDAWAQVTIEAEEVLTVPRDALHAELPITVHNKSDHALSPDGGNGVLLSFRLVDADGSTLEFECARTALQAEIPAGATHQQMLEVVIPAEFKEETAGIRVGFLQRGEYWVERIAAEHPRLVLIKQGNKKDRSKSVLEQAANVWQQGNNNGLRWPYNSMMVADAYKLQYIPIAKCGCTSLKALMVQLAGINNPELALKLDVHLITDRFNTGALMKDRPIEEAREMLAADDYFRFGVIRAPFDRLRSAYLEKFVINRHSDRNLLHTRPVISAVQNTNAIDRERSISFDEFVGYVVQQDPWQLDTHWRPQHLYFRGIRNMSRIFRLEDMGALEHKLCEITGKEIKLGHRNRTTSTGQRVANIAAMTATDIDKLKDFDVASFEAGDTYQRVHDYYREDFELYESLQ